MLRQATVLSPRGSQVADMKWVRPKAICLALCLQQGLAVGNGKTTEASSCVPAQHLVS